MLWSWFIAVSLFALITSISPGPVNVIILALASQGKYGLAWRFVAGATLGFCLLLLLIGLGAKQLFAEYAWLTLAMQWLGTVFLLWLAWVFWHSSSDAVSDTDKADFDTHGKRKRPLGFIAGNLVQWLNPKAWMVAVVVVGLYGADSLQHLYGLTAIYAVLCFASLGCWVGLGWFIRRHSFNSHKNRANHNNADKAGKVSMTLINRILAGLLVITAVMTWL
ncbi:LysE family translocator [Psychrobacter sp. I-STPA10]|uniref:LysE family translocator n=1 Tax=Psychrobacter sp. I-STPA10 TaxID=2585769 RepID=UPI001E4BCA75|nr:LysE family transporter [Psychrobacter sp. I-STPA10]